VDSLLAAIDALSGGETAKLLDQSVADTAPSRPSNVAPPPAIDDSALNRAKDWRRLLLDSLQPSADEEEEFRGACARFLKLPEGQPFYDVRRALSDVKDSAAELSLPDGAGHGAAGTQQKTTLDALLDDILLDPSEAGNPAAPGSNAPDLRAPLARIDDQLRAAFPNLPASGGSALDALLTTLNATINDEGAPNDPISRSQAALERQKEKLNEAIANLDEQEAKIVDGAAAMRRTSPEPTYPQKPMSSALARRFGEFIVAEHKKGTNLAGRDLAGADLRGADLAGADLEGALLEKADLSEARFTGARLAKAALAGATLDGADLSDADLSAANLAKCRARKAIFARCQLSDSFLLETDFTGANFEKARLDKLTVVKCAFDETDFSGASMTASSLIQSSFARTIWNGANLEAMSIIEVPLTGAQFRAARLFRCSFLKVEAQDSDFEDAELTRSAFNGDADLTGARFNRAIGIDSSFIETKLQRASFAAGIFNRATFIKSDLTGANFRLASLKGSLFGGAKLVGADFVGANLLKAQLRRADLSGARMIGANFYAANVDGAIFTTADLTGVNLGKTFLAVDSNVG
jgi:uncharacterized protein YjbI with pentapeptide repeats